MKTPLLMVAYWLFALGIVMEGMIVFVAIILAYAYVPEANKKEKTHFTYLIRTFWLFIIYWGIATVSVMTVLAFIGLGWGELKDMFNHFLWLRLFFGPACCGGLLQSEFYPLWIRFIIAAPYVLLLLWGFSRLIKGIRLLLKKKPIPDPKTPFI